MLLLLLRTFLVLRTFLNIYEVDKIQKKKCFKALQFTIKIKRNFTLKLEKDKGEDGVFFSIFGFDFNSVQSFLST